jgi:hypothetical protein
MMNQGEQEERVLDLRRKVEELWRESSPMFGDEPVVEAIDETAGLPDDQDE